MRTHENPNIPLDYTRQIIDNVIEVLSEAITKQKHGKSVDGLIKSLAWWNDLQVIMSDNKGLVPAEMNDELPQQLVDAILSICGAGTSTIYYALNLVRMCTESLCSMQDSLENYNRHKATMLLGAMTWLNDIIATIEDTGCVPNDEIENGLWPVIVALWNVGVID